MLQVWSNLLEGTLPITLPLLKIKYTDNRKASGDRDLELVQTCFWYSIFIAS